jgi:hypothetical protein
VDTSLIGPDKQRDAPTSRIRDMGEGWTFERVSITLKWKPRIFYRCRFIPQSGAHRGNQCEFCVRNDTPAFWKLKNSRHPHQWPIRAFVEEPFIPPHQTPLPEEFARFVCLANVLLNQEAQPFTKHFCDVLIRYGFQLGRAR